MILDTLLKNPTDSPNKNRKLKRDRIRKHSIALLNSKCIPFKSVNGDSMLTIKHGDEMIEFYPTTGVWKIIDEYIGVEDLVKYIKG